MNILIVSATEVEITPFIQHLKTHWKQEEINLFSNNDTTIQLLITGVGMVATTYALTKILQHKKFDFALQVGIAGSYDANICLGDVVFITSEEFGDLGAEDHYNQLDIFELDLQRPDDFPFQNKKLITPLNEFHKQINLLQVSGLTVNTVSGATFTTESRRKKYNCIVESMEGAAFHYICLQENIAFAQVRSVSNYVAVRDKTKWKMAEAVEKLNQWMIKFIALKIT